jgi:hypothetical protein
MDGWMIRALICFFLFTHAAVGQSWQTVTEDDGSFYFGLAYVPGNLGLFCGGKSPQGVSPQVTGNVEPRVTKRGQLGLEMSDALIGQNQSRVPRNDVMIVVGNLGYRLPQISRNELVGTQEQFLQENDPLVRALQSGEAIEIRTEQGRRTSVPTDGAPASIATVIAYCNRLANTRPAVDLTAAAQAYIFSACAGQAQATQGYLLQGDLDLDGLNDIVVDWSRITCPGSHPRPFCGAANCSVDVFLSRKFRQGRQPDGYLAIGVEMQNSPFGGVQLLMGGNLNNCGGVSVCQSVLRWDGRQLAWFAQ